MRVSTSILLTALALGGAACVGKVALSNLLIGNASFKPIAPGRVNLIGITPGAGYRIIIANDVAQLVETQGSGFGGKEEANQGATEGSIKKRVPMRELLGVLRGDSKSLGAFVMKMNSINENDDSWPTTRVVWTKERIDKAIAGDPKEKAALERDLNVRLDGTPLTRLNRNSLENGIVVAAPVELTVNIDGKPRVVRGETLEPYKPGFIKAVEAHYKDKAADNAMVAGYYADEASGLLKSAGKRENVASALQHMTSQAVMNDRLAIPRRLLSNATVVVNESFIDDARYKSYRTSDGHTLSDLSVDLSDEGRRRLWKFTKDRVGDQILLVENDVAVAAPRIEHELALSEFTVTQMPDELLVRETVDTIKAAKGTASR